MNYLALCQELAEELGVGGAEAGSGIPSAVAGQTAQLGNVVRWITQANNHINNQYQDWKFLWTEYSETMTVGSRIPPTHGTGDGNTSVTVRRWDKTSFWLNKNTDEAIQLMYVEWNVFRRHYETGDHSENSVPTYFTIKPDNSLVLDVPSEEAYTITGEFWRRPTLLSSDTDTPDIPEEYHRAIVCGAAILYAGKEAAQGIQQSMAAEYSMFMNQLSADQTFGNEQDTLSAIDDDLLVGIPGHVGGEYNG